MSPIDLSPPSSTSSASSGSSSSSSSSSVHKASLVDASLHSPALLEMLDIKLSRPIIEYVVDCVVDTVDYAMGRASSSRGRQLARAENSPFTTFVTNVITRAELTTPVVLASLVYIDRAKPHLHIALEEWALERVFLGAVIIASKYLNDSTLKNVHWALCTGVFGKRDVGRIEREFLDVLDFQLAVTEDDLLSHHHNITAVVHPSHVYHRHAATTTTSHHPSAPSSRNSRYSAVPSLDPSSPAESSSSSDSSPSTPSSLSSSSNSPEFVVVATSTESSVHSSSSDMHPKAKVRVQPPPARPKRSSFHLPNSTMDLLRSFPVPLHHYRQGHRNNNNNNSSRAPPHPQLVA